MRVLVAGYGSIGRRHVANLRALEADLEIVVWHTSGHSREDVDLADGLESVTTLDAALKHKPGAAIVACPAPQHVPVACQLAASGVHLLIEKPLSDRLDGIDSLIEGCRNQHLVLMVGYTLRYHEPLRVLRQAVSDGAVGRVLHIRAEYGRYLPDWRPGTDYRRGVSAQKALGGGVVLELSHEIDYLRWIGGEIKTVTATLARLGDLEIDVEDTAEILVRFESGALGSVHLDMLQRAPRRECRVTGSNGTLTWDGLTHQTRLFSADTGCWTDLQAPKAVDDNDMYRAELRHFLACVRGNATPCPTGADGRRVLEIALAARASADRGAMVAV